MAKVKFRERAIRAYLDPDSVGGLLRLEAPTLTRLFLGFLALFGLALLAAVVTDVKITARGRGLVRPHGGIFVVRAPSEGYVRWAVEPYGGLIVATWSDRDLGLSGRVALRGESGVETRLLRVDRPLARIPNLAIHLNRRVNDEGLKLNKQTDLPPMVALATSRCSGANLPRLMEIKRKWDPDNVFRHAQSVPLA